MIKTNVSVVRASVNRIKSLTNIFSDLNSWVYLTIVPSADMEGEGLTSYTKASRQGAIQMFLTSILVNARRLEGRCSGFIRNRE